MNHREISDNVCELETSGGSYRGDGPKITLRRFTSMITVMLTEEKDDSKEQRDCAMTQFTHEEARALGEWLLQATEKDSG